MEPAHTSDSKLHFLDYWRIIRIRKLVILAVFLLIVITTTFVTFWLPEFYASTVRIAVEKDTPDITTLGNQPMAAGFDPYFIMTEFQKIQSRMVLDNVISNLNLNEKWGEKEYGKGTVMKTVDTFNKLKNRMKLDQFRNTSIIEIKVFSENAKEAADLANSIAEEYRRSRHEQKIQWAKLGIETLRQRLISQSNRVEEAESKLEELRKKLKISDIEASTELATSTLESESMRRLEFQRTEANADFLAISTLMSKLVDLSKDPIAFREAVPIAFPDPQMTSLLEGLHLTQQKLAIAEKDYGPQHVEVVRYNALQKKIEEQINEHLRGVMEGLTVKVGAAKARYDKLQDELDKKLEAQRNTVGVNSEYFVAKRDLARARQVRETLGLKIIQEEIDMAITKSSSVVVTDRAEEAVRPVRPNKPLNIILGIVVGLIVGVGLAFFIEYLDTSVKTLDDVERVLQSPVLGVIPQNVGSLLEQGPESPHAESYRVLRTNMLFSRKSNKQNSLAIISGGAGEGKSTTIFNLATTFAQSGDRVLIVDSDLRRPSLQKFFNVSNTIGLTNFLLKQNTLEEVIQTTPLPTLDFMPSGKLPSTSMGILNSVQMKDLIQELKRRYDFVFFDSPPILGVSDASVLASEVDMTLMVIQYRKYPQIMTVRAKQMVEKVAGNLLGVVLNNINISQDSYYYYYSGGYYDYYSKNENEAAPANNGEDKPAEEKSRFEFKRKF